MTLPPKTVALKTGKPKHATPSALVVRAKELLELREHTARQTTL